MTRENLFNYVKTIRSRADFVEFLNYFNGDYQHNRADWENDNLQDFLSGLEGFATDMDGYYKNTDKSVDVESISWRMVAEMLLAATVYE